MTKNTSLCLFTAVLTAASAQAADALPATVSGWHATSLAQAIGYMLMFSLIGITTAILGYRLFDKCTPGDLHKEIIENKNIAAAMIGGAVILGVCIIVAAAMMG